VTLETLRGKKVAHERGKDAKGLCSQTKHSIKTGKIRNEQGPDTGKRKIGGGGGFKGPKGPKRGGGGGNAGPGPDRRKAVRGGGWPQKGEKHRF